MSNTSKLIGIAVVCLLVQCAVYLMKYSSCAKYKGDTSNVVLCQAKMDKISWCVNCMLLMICIGMMYYVIRTPAQPVNTPKFGIF